MRPSAIVETQIAADAGAGFRNAGVGVPVNLFAYAACLQPLVLLAFPHGSANFFERSVIV